MGIFKHCVTVAKKVATFQFLDLEDRRIGQVKFYAKSSVWSPKPNSRSAHEQDLKSEEGRKLAVSFIDTSILYKLILAGKFKHLYFENKRFARFDKIWSNGCLIIRLVDHCWKFQKPATPRVEAQEIKSILTGNAGNEYWFECQRHSFFKEAHCDKKCRFATVWEAMPSLIFWVIIYFWGFFLLSFFTKKQSLSRIYSNCLFFWLQKYLLCHYPSILMFRSIFVVIAETLCISIHTFGQGQVSKEKKFETLQTM